MSYKVKVEGLERFEIAKECVRSVKFTTDIPLDSNARTKDVGSTVTITGRILTAVDGAPFDSTRKLALWSAVPAEKSDCYRKVTIRRRGRHRNLYSGDKAEERQAEHDNGRRRVSGRIRVVKGES